MPSESERLAAATDAVNAFCAARVPADLADQIRLEATRRGRSITIHERRPPWHPDDADSDWTRLAIAQLRHDGKSGTWSLHYRDSSDRWWAYDGIGRAASVQPLLAEIDRDPTGIFWG